jgi:hypothetical protein
VSIADKVNWLYLVVAGGIIHLIMDWFAQNHWQATHKMLRRDRWQTMRVTQDGYEDEVISLPAESKWWDRDPAAYAHAGLHFLPLLLIFPFWAALIIAILHLIIDTRSPLDWWGKFTRQTISQDYKLPVNDTYGAVESLNVILPPTVMDVGKEVGFWRDQTAHIAVIAGVALLCVL